MILILFTNSYPFDYSAERTFLERELPYLAKNIDSVIVVPKLARGKKLLCPEKVRVEEDFSLYYKKHTKLIPILFNALKSTFLYKELFSKPFLLLSPLKLARLILFIGRAICTYNWLSSWLQTLDNDRTILLYTFWFDDLTMGLCLIKKDNPEVLLVTRAHGFDIYEELYFPYYWPLRQESLALLDKVFPASNDGRNYFRKRYPQFRNLFETAYLGVNDPGFLSSPSNDNIFRIVSCAHVVPLKRTDLLVKGIAFAASVRPEQRIEWIHFGDGKERRSLQAQINRSFPANAVGEMPGYVPNHNIMLHYKEKPVDVLVNLSTTEGGAPVSIQEAISCGIPIIATNIGGNPEVVTAENGILLGENPSPEDVAQALWKIWDNPDKTSKMRKASRSIWEKKFNADVNYPAFCDKLKGIEK